MFQILTQLFGSKYERDLKKIQPFVNAVREQQRKMKGLSDQELKAKTPYFKDLIEKGKKLDDILPEAFAVCILASQRVLDMTHYDVQIIGALVLHQGEIAEMKTGEGKTLVATLPVYLNALSGRGVHVVTVNDYLAQRDKEWMGQLYQFLGLTTGAIVNDLDDSQRKKAYLADITYGTNNEFGFDYLRDNMKYSLDSCVQRELNYAIVDECDSILIDEARTPLIISGAKDISTDKYYAVKKVIPHLQREKHFTMEEKSKSISITEEGNSKIEEILGISNLYDMNHIEYLHNIYQSLKAHHLFKKDVDYMVQNDEVVIVDEFTGRLMPGRRWSEGLHQAVEVKEGVKVKTENQTLCSITFQNYFRMYNKLAGMTGTAETEAEEFRKIYQLRVQVIPTNKPIRRDDEHDEVYKTELIKYKHIGEKIKTLYKKHQPVLVGTVSIEKSEKLSHILSAQNIPHKVLNAKYHEKEAEIVAQAGRKGAITIATNMAGRGTDIVLGGNPEFLCGPRQKEESESDYQKRLAQRQEICQKEKEEVIEAGGLFIIGTERHEARRIDNQLRGRSGRQGDPGASQFYLSLEDDLMRIFGGERMQKLMTTLRMDEEAPITDRLITRGIANAQRKVEGHNFEIRKHLLEYDDVMNQQRMAIYLMRRSIMKKEALERMFLDHLGDLISHQLDQTINENIKKEDWDFKFIDHFLKRIFNLEITWPKQEQLSLESVNEIIQKEVKQCFRDKKEELKEHFEPVIQFLFLQTIDNYWKEHLENVDRLREGINLRSFAQKDPLVEYKKETFKLFEALNLSVAEQVIEKFFKIQLSQRENFKREERASDLIYSDSDSASFQAPEIPRPNSASPDRQLNRKERRKRSMKKQRIKI